jgi:hypothetical protein
MRDLRAYAATRWWVPFIGAVLALVLTAVATEIHRDSLAHLAGSSAWALGLFGCVVALVAGVGK